MTERRAEREDVRRRVRLKMIAFITLGGSFLRNNTGTSSSTAASNEAIGKNETINKSIKEIKRVVYMEVYKEQDKTDDNKVEGSWESNPSAFL